MITVELNRVHGDYGFEVTDESGKTVHIDNSPEHGGDNFGVRPMQMVLMALAGCSGMDVISILKKQRQNVAGYKTIVKGEREPGVEPSVWKKAELEFIIYGDVDEGKAQRAVELSINKYCSVAETLRRAGADITWSVSVVAS
ncbi:OsmC family protein [Parafilimonas sp.]|uniref:OsmC family protein n=1 Tax=Parafilimonas sp. TaxID=1969739 RepID=UPI0039E43C7B